MHLAFGLLLFLPFITVVISLHELGHFMVARRFGMKVDEYFIGFGPRIWSRRKGELEYGIKALPLGGYVKIAGMNPRIAPTQIVSWSPIVEPRMPPMIPPSGMVPQTRNRTVAFIRPCIRGGQIAWR